MGNTAFDLHERDNWRGKADAYAASFAGLCAYTAEPLLDAAGVGPGTHVLDVGTGLGTVAELARDRNAVVVAVDAEPDMVVRARQRVPEARIERAILPELPFAGETFDATVANFVVNHVGDPPAAVTELRRVTRSGGRVAVTTWPAPPPELQMLWHHCFEAAGAVRPSSPVVDADCNFARTREGVEKLLRDAGLKDVSVREMAWTHRADPELWWSGPAVGLGTAGVVLTAQTPEVIAKIRAEYDRRVGDKLELRTSALLAVGTA